MKRVQVILRDYFFYNDESLAEKETVINFDEKLTIAEMGQKLIEFTTKYPDANVSGTGVGEEEGFYVTAGEDLDDNISVVHDFIVYRTC